MTELKDMRADRAQLGDKAEIVIDPVADNLYHWSGYILGPVDTPFHEGKFFIDVSIPQSYPMSAPTIRFITRVFHPNVHFKVSKALVIDV
eukprot:c18176_g1_i4.p1 GENE.c18176_g1_i4~~c18176_g1_i4.p1  ORF type:complete len:105 (+),score=12.91 c18176_g1_i4:46-315(+)